MGCWLDCQNHWGKTAKGVAIASLPALRCGGGIVLSSWAVCVSGFYASIGGICFLAPVLAVILSTPTLGSSLTFLSHSLAGSAFSIICSSFFMWIVLHVDQPGKAILFVFFLSAFSFLVQLSSFPPVFKKIGLVVAMVMTVNVYYEGLPDDNPLFNRSDSEDLGDSEEDEDPNDLFVRYYQSGINLLLSVLIGGLSAAFFLIFPTSMTASSHLRRELKDSLETCGTLLELVVSLYSETPSSFDFHCLRVKIEDKEAKIRATLSQWDSLLQNLWWEQMVGLPFRPFVRFALKFLPRNGAPPCRDEGEEFPEKGGWCDRRVGYWFLWLFPFLGDITVPICPCCLALYKRKILDILLFIGLMRHIIESLSTPSATQAYFSAQIRDVMDKTTEDSIWHLKALSEFYTPHSLSFYSVSTGLYKESYTAFMAAVQRARMVVIYGVPLGEGEKEEDFMEKRRGFVRPLPLALSQHRAKKEGKEKGKEEEEKEDQQNKKKIHKKTVSFGIIEEEEVHFKSTVEIHDDDSDVDRDDGDEDGCFQRDNSRDDYEEKDRFLGHEKSVPRPKFQRKKSIFEFSKSSWGVVRYLNPFCFAFRYTTRMIEEMTLISSHCENCNPEWMKQRASSSVLITPNNNTDSDISPPSFINKVHGSGYSSSEEELNNFASKWDEENPDDLPPSPPATLFPSPSPSSHPSSPFPSPATSLPTQEAVCLYCRPIVDFFSAVFEYFSQFFMCIPNMRQKGRYYFFSREFIGSFQFSVAIFLALLIVVVPAISDQFRNEYWAALTVCFVMERGSVRGSFFTSILRLIGTVAGSLAAYFTLLAIGDNDSLQLLFMFLWTVACGYVRASKKYSYSGAVAAFTFPIILYGGDLDGDGDELRNFSLARIELTFLGVMCVVIGSLIAPISAQSLLKHEQASLLVHLRDEIRAGCDAYLHLHNFRSEPERVLALRKIRGSLTRQKLLTKEAEGEPELCVGPFNSGPYQALLSSELKIVQAIVVMHKCIAIPQEGRGLEQFPLVMDRVVHHYEKVRDAIIDMVDSLLLLFAPPKIPWGEGGGGRGDGEGRQFVLMELDQSLEELQDSVLIALSDVVGNVDSLGPLSTVGALTLSAMQMALATIASEGHGVWRHGTEIVARTGGFS